MLALVVNYTSDPPKTGRRGRGVVEIHIPNGLVQRDDSELDTPHPMTHL